MQKCLNLVYAVAAAADDDDIVRTDTLCDSVDFIGVVLNISRGGFL
jgi:hypothetical protein